MATEKDITDRSLEYGMGNKPRKPKGTSSGYENPSNGTFAEPSVNPYLNGNFKLNLDRRVGESPDDYRLRLFAIRSTQIETIVRYEREKSLDRYRMTDRTFKGLIEGNENEEDDAKRVILGLQRELDSYSENHLEMSSRKNIREKLDDLRSLG